MDLMFAHVILGKHRGSIKSVYIFRIFRNLHLPNVLELLNTSLLTIIISIHDDGQI